MLPDPKSDHQTTDASAQSPLSSAGSALGGAELLTGMMSFNPTARRFHAHGEEAVPAENSLPTKIGTGVEVESDQPRCTDARRKLSISGCCVIEI